jgi:hypothetical protein
VKFKWGRFRIQIIGLIGLILSEIRDKTLFVFQNATRYTLHDSRRYTIPRCLGPSHPDSYKIRYKIVGFHDAIYLDSYLDSYLILKIR